MSDESPAKILVVESEGSLRRSLVTVLEAADYRILQAADYEAACRMIEGESVDLALVSTELGAGPSGFAVIRAVRATRPEGCVCIAVLDEPDTEDLLAVLRLGVGEALLKPVRPSELIAAVRGLLGEDLFGDSNLPAAAPNDEGGDLSDGTQDPPQEGAA